MNMPILTIKQPNNVMMSLVVTCTLLLPCSVQAGRGSKVVDVLGERMMMQKVLPKLAQRIGAWEVDLGPSPQPGKLRTLTKRHIQAQLRRARFLVKGLRIPEHVVVRRRAQTLSEEQLAILIGDGVRSKLPQNVKLMNIRVQGVSILPQGVVGVEVEPPRRWRQGQQSIAVHLFVDGKKQRRLLVGATVEMPHKGRAETVVQRGARVRIVARARGVVVRSRGVVQSAGRVGQIVPVLPIYGRKLVHARVLDAGVVEVDL